MGREKFTHSVAPKGVVDSLGNHFPSIRAAAMYHNIGGSNLARSLAKRGTYRQLGGVTLRYDTGKPQEPTEPVQDAHIQAHISQIIERYTLDELALLAKGEGLRDMNTAYQKVRLHGKHHRMGIISDTHIGSKYTPDEWLLKAFEEFDKTGCECILHAGDLVDGLKVGRMGTQIYELSEIGYTAQRDKAVELFSHTDLPVYIISGNHDAYYSENAGANIVEDVCARVPNMTYLGHDQADIDIDGAVIRLFHGGDGSSYATSYRLQKLVESFTGGKKPNILIAGHVHKFCHIFERNIEAVSAPCLQMQTNFMRAKKLAAHTGFLVMDFDVVDGGICNFGLKLYPFYG